MNIKKQQSYLHTFVLILMLLISAGVVWYARGQTQIQILVGIITSIAYVGWGVIHHILKGDLHPRVVIEYVLVGLIAIVLLLTLAL